MVVLGRGDGEAGATNIGVAASRGGPWRRGGAAQIWAHLGLI